MGAYKVDAPDSLFTIPKAYAPMDEAQIAQVYRNVLQDHAIKKLK